MWGSGSISRCLLFVPNSFLWRRHAAPCVERLGSAKCRVLSSCILDSAVRRQSGGDDEDAPECRRRRQGEESGRFSDSAIRVLYFYSKLTGKSSISLSITLTLCWSQSLEAEELLMYYCGRMNGRMNECDNLRTLVASLIPPFSPKLRRVVAIVR